MKKKEFTKAQELAYELKVEQAMTRNVVKIKPHRRIGQLREILRARKISGTPVVNGHNRLVGIISIEDFIKCLVEGEMNARVDEKMSRNVVSLFSDEPLIHAVNKFEKHGYGRFPVVDRSTGTLVGIITKGNIIRTLLKALEVDYHEEEIHRYRASHIFEDMAAKNVSLSIDCDVAGQDFTGGGEAASALKKSLLRLDLNPKIVRRVAIAAYEAEMNIVIFTPGGKLNTRVDQKRIRVVATDSGQGIPDIEQAMKPGFSTAPNEVREMGFGAGMGLPNIKKCADEFRIESEAGKGTRIEASFHMKEGAG